MAKKLQDCTDRGNTDTGLINCIQAVIDDTVNEAVSGSTGGSPYLSYVATLQKGGGEEPTVINVFENTLGGDLVWSRIPDSGIKGTLTGIFPNDNSKIFYDVKFTTGNLGVHYPVTIFDTNNINIYQYSLINDGGIRGEASEMNIEFVYVTIKVYP